MFIAVFVSTYYGFVDTYSITVPEKVWIHIGTLWIQNGMVSAFERWAIILPLSFPFQVSSPTLDFKYLLFVNFNK